MSTQNIDQAKVRIREMLKAEKYPQVRFVASQLLKKHGADAELFYLRGTACARHAAGEQAIKDLRSAIKLRPRCVDYYLALSNALFANGRFEQALIEFVRVRGFAAGHPKVRGYANRINPRNGRLKDAIEDAEAALARDPEQTAMVNRLASLYFVAAIFDWRARPHEKGLTFFATSARQLTRAERYLARLQTLPVATHAVKVNRSKLANLIETNRRRRYDGFMGDPIIAVLVIVIGVGLGGFVDLWYALSALSSFVAFRRPGYIFNQGPPRRPASLQGRLEFILDMAYASHINENHVIFRGIPGAAYRALAADSVRALLRAAAMPVSVLAGFYRNYSFKHAAGFLAGSILLAYALSL